MKRILVSGASGVVGYGVLRALRSTARPYFSVGTSIYNDSVAPAFCDVFELAPHTDAPEYLDWLLDTLRRHRIDLMIPGIEIDMYHWATNLSALRATGARPLLNTPELIALCEDKWLFYRRLTQENVACAIDSSLENNFDTLRQRFGLPFLLKPRRGFGSKGIVRVTSREIFEPYRADMGAVLMAQPIVGNDDEEFTVSAFCDGLGGYFNAMALQRRLSGGFTHQARAVDAAEFGSTIDILCGLFRPHGPTNFQFRRCFDGPKLLEINPRISSSTSIRAAFGYNESAMAVDYFLDGLEPVQPPIRRGWAVRYSEDQVFYEDGVYL